MKQYLDFRNKNDFEALRIPADIIKNGGIVVFPTETVYGIGTNGLNKEAVKKLYKIKRRPLNKPISLLVSDFKMIDIIAKNITEVEYKIMRKYFPGPLTIILEKKDIVPSIVSGGEKTIGVRMPKDEITRKLIEYAEVPIAAPSANISGNPSGTEIEKISNEFQEDVDYYIDGGKSKIGVGSTIVKVEDGKIRILREGTITKKEIEEYLLEEG